MRSSTVVCVMGFLLAAAQAFATKAKKAPAPAAEEAPAQGEEAAAPKEETESQRAFKSIQWTQGPAKVGIGGHAEIQVPEGFAYTGATGAQKLLELMHNPTSGTELGILTDEDLDMFRALRVRGHRLRQGRREGEAGRRRHPQVDPRGERSVQRGAQGARLACRSRIVGWHTAPFYNARPTTSSGASRARARATRSSTTTPGSSAARA